MIWQRLALQIPPFRTLPDACDIRDAAVVTRNSAAPPWWRCWEFYFIFLLAAFLRLYQLGHTEFDDDQIQIFTLARYAVIHKLLVATSNIASIHIYNPPAIIYALMLPAALSANPLGGAFFTALLSIFAVLLSYGFTCRYYGRVAGTVAALLYAVASWAVFYARFMWNQNMLHLPVILFFWFLYRGSVDHRRGWLVPAVLLLLLVVQFHASSVVLVVPLVIALLLVPRSTLRWYEPFLCLLCCALLYFPYLVWLSATHFHDLVVLLHSSHARDLLPDALLLYQGLLSPLGPPYLNPRAVLYPYRVCFPFIEWSLTLLLLVGMLLALLRLLCGQGDRKDQWEKGARRRCLFVRCFLVLRDWWLDVRVAPERCGLLILLAWQLIPLLSLLRPGVKLHPHYFIIFMPGIFILIGLCVAALVHTVQRFPMPVDRLYRLLLYGVVVLFIAGEGVATLGYEIDASSGHFVDGAWSNVYDDLGSMQHALQVADQLALRFHYRELFVEVDAGKRAGMAYLAQSLSTPTMLGSDNCLLLPAPARGPALLLLGPRSTVAATLAVTIAHARLLETVSRLGGPPYRLYLLPASPLATAAVTLVSPARLSRMQLLVTQLHQGQLFSHYQLTGSEEPGYHVEHVFTFRRLAAASRTFSSFRTATASERVGCHFSNYRSGTQVIVPLGGMASGGARALAEQVTAYDVQPRNVYYTLFNQTIPMSTFAIETSKPVVLRTLQGETSFYAKITPVTTL